MKHFFAVALLSLLVTKALAQDCKFEQKDKDGFTGKTKVTNVFILGGHFWYMTKLDTTYTIELKSKEFKGALQQGIEKGSPVEFRLVNGEIVTARAADNVEPVVKVVGGTDIKSTFRVVYQLTKTELTKMSQAAPAAYRLSLGGINESEEISEKKGESMKTTAKCMLEHND